MEFSFVLNGVRNTFTSDENSLRKTFHKEFPTYELHEEFCMCMDACDCDDGYFVAGSEWVSIDPAKPWIGETVTFHVHLEVSTYYKNGGKMYRNYYGNR